MLALAKKSGDPYIISDLPYLSKLKVNIEQNKKIEDKKLIVYLSKEPLTDNTGAINMEYGHIKQNLFDGVFSFPELVPNSQEFTFTYLHPDNYYITIVADINQDGYISKGDITSKSRLVKIEPNTEQSLSISDIIFEN